MKCAISTVTLRSDGILEIYIKDNEHFDLSDMQELIAAAKSIGNGKKFLNLVIVQNGTLPTKEARDYSSSKEGSIYKLADAFVIESLAQKIIGNFIIKFNKPPVPTSLFNNEEDAVAWLKSLDVWVIQQLTF